MSTQTPFTQSPLAPQNGTRPAMPPEAQQLLEQLNDIAPLGEISWWPLAPGWWILSVLCIVTVFLLFFYGHQFVRQSIKQSRYRKAALAEWSALQQDHTNATDFLKQVSALLKRTAIQAYPKQKGVFLNAYGDQWPTLLQNICPRAPLTRDSSRVLAVGLYQPDVQFDRSELSEFVTYWIKHHPPKYPIQMSSNGQTEDSVKPKAGARYV